MREECDDAKSQRKLTRRALMTGALRGAALAALGAVGVVLISRGGAGRPIEAGQDCVNRGLCRGCGSIGGCGLPQATMARDMLKNGRRFG